MSTGITIHDSGYVQMYIYFRFKPESKSRHTWLILDPGSTNSDGNGQLIMGQLMLFVTDDLFFFLLHFINILWVKAGIYLRL